MPNETKDYVQQIAELSIATDPTLFVDQGEQQCLITELPFNTWGNAVDENGTPKYATNIACSLVYLENNGNGQANKWAKSVQNMQFWAVYDEDGNKYIDDEDEEGSCALWNWFENSRECGIGGEGFWTLDGKTQEYIPIEVTITWKDYNNNSISKSGSVDVYLYRRGAEGEEDVLANITTITVEESQATSEWTSTIKDVPRYYDTASALTYTYSIRIVSSDNCSFDVACDDEGDKIVATVVATINSTDYVIRVNQYFTTNSDSELTPFRWTGRGDIYTVTIYRKEGDRDYEEYTNFVLDPFLYGVVDPSVTLSLVHYDTETGKEYTYKTECTNDNKDVEFKAISDERDQTGAYFSATLNGICEDAFSTESVIMLTINSTEPTTFSSLGVTGITFENEENNFAMAVMKTDEGWVNANRDPDRNPLPEEELTEYSYNIRILKYPFYKSYKDIYGLGKYSKFNIIVENDKELSTIEPTSYDNVTYDNNVQAEYSFSIKPI